MSDPRSRPPVNYTKRQIDRVGRTLVAVDREPFAGRQAAQHVLNNWRAAHSHPLNSLRSQLRRIATNVDGDATVAQRLKRDKSIKIKLEREPSMKLSRMQDIGGCRAVVSSIPQIYEIAERFKHVRTLHRLLYTRDYVDSPKSTGYRSLHLVYSYRGRQATGYDGLRIEIQLRTRLQHAWATAVETVSVFENEDLKAGQGGPVWLRFFALVASAMATAEGTPSVPGTPTDTGELKSEVLHLVKTLEVRERLNHYTETLNQTTRSLRGPVHYFLMKFEPGKGTTKVLIIPYKRDELPRAYNDYVQAEATREINTVLVSANSMNDLRSAYPNYFNDTAGFLLFLQRLLR